MQDGLYCENQQSVIIEALQCARKNIKIAVAWINFDEYKNIFIDLKCKGVKIKILINDDVMNRRYQAVIDSLIALGIKIRFVTMPSKSGYMHHKFCVIDNLFYMSGSFNWTKNALKNNMENLVVSHDKKMVDEYKYEFKSIWELTQCDLEMLKNPELCECCSQPIITICVFSENGYYHTKADLYKICDCDCEYTTSDYFDISVFNNLMGIFDYDDDAYVENEVKNYLSTIRKNRMGFPIIHAVGVYSWEWISKDDGEYIIKVLWKEKYMGQYVLDTYSFD